MLSDNCDRVEELEYLKPFDTDNLSELKDKLSDVSIEINDIEEEKKQVNAGYNDSMKMLKVEKKTILENLRNKAERVKEHCYMFFDHQTKVVAYYNAEGKFVSSRPMKPQEMIKTVFAEIRHGEASLTCTND